MQFSMNFMIVLGMLVCSSFLISDYCVESYARIEYDSDCSRRGSYLVEPLFYSVIE